MSQKFIFVLLALVAQVITGSGCGAMRNINFYSTSEEVRLGQALSKEIARQYSLLNDERVDSFLQERGEKLVAVSDRTDLKYYFTAVNDEVINAFAIPGGYCYINIGLIRGTKTEAELISVVAHELAHVTNRHSVKRLSQMQLADAAQQIVLGSSGSVANMVANMFTTMGLLNYSREAEREADRDGLHFMYKAGYDPQGMVDMFQLLMSKQEGAESEGWQNVFSTHPMTGERIENARRLIAELPPKDNLVLNSPQWEGLKNYIAEKYPPVKKEGQKEGSAAENLRR